LKVATEAELFRKIALVAHPGLELASIREMLKNPLRYSVREFLSMEEIKDGLRQYPFDILMLRLKYFDARHLPLLAKTRSAFPSVGLITLAGEIDPGARFQVRSLSSHKLLHEPMELQDLHQVIDKLAKGDSQPIRLHPRVRREGGAELVDMKYGFRHPAKFLDFAQMGARLTVTAKVPLVKNRHYQLHYPSSSDTSRIHKLETKVIWEKVTSGLGTIVCGPEQEVGLRFIAALE
jgi:DNA-binding NarL/FixJ family response regulator